METPYNLGNWQKPQLHSSKNGPAMDTKDDLFPKPKKIKEVESSHAAMSVSMSILRFQ